MSLSLELDLLAPFEIWEIHLKGSTIKFHKPLVLQPYWLPNAPEEPEENDYLGVEIPELEIFAFGSDRRELWNCIRGDIRSAWTHFVQVPDNQNTTHGRAIKANYLALAEEMIDEE